MNWLRLVILNEAFKTDLPLSKFVFGYYGANGSTTLHSIAGVVAGYVIVKSFYKRAD
ncbi:hypothetical protein [Peribacillus simplex]|uniref:hypothetical protein n=1 Tax=Peribacillus simplex TaxID=1478 RepID=UPI001E5FDF97|nr:hypothetical protein [Peribacillus simplex]